MLGTRLHPVRVAFNVFIFYSFIQSCFLFASLSMFILYIGHELFMFIR